MPAFKDLTGQRFGRLVALTFEKRPQGAWWHCRCDCGGTAVVRGAMMTRGNTSSCGCIQREQLAARNRKHDLHGQGPYQTWKHMRRRCYAPSSLGYQWYGVRGISICDAWQDYGTFHAWAMSSGWQKGLTIERIDNDGNYEPGNCTWIPNELQSKNKRDNRAVVRGDGKHYALLADAARDMGCSTTQISAACRGTQKTAHGYTWRYA
jgi:hypothetical protein